MIKEKIYGNMFYNNKWYSYFKAKYPKGELADYQRTTGEEEIAGPFYMKSSVENTKKVQNMSIKN